MKDYCAYIEDEFERRQLKNKNYSLRAFARDLSISTSQLSEVLNRKRGLSPQKALEVAKAMELGEFDTTYFLKLVSAKHDRSKERRKRAQKEVESRDRLLNRKVITTKHIQMMNWLGFAIRRLSQHKDFWPDAHWIAERFGVSVQEVEPRLEYLLEKGFIEEKNGSWGIGENVFYNSSQKRDKEDILEFHRQALAEVYKALSTENLDIKDIAGHVFSLKKSQVAKIKEMIRDFEDQIDKVTYEEGENIEEVFYYTSFLFPLTKKIT